MSQEHKTKSQRHQRSDPKKNYENTACLFLETALPFQHGRNAGVGLWVHRQEMRTDPRTSGLLLYSVLQKFWRKR